MFRYYQVCSWQSCTHCVNLPTPEAPGVERRPLRAASRAQLMPVCAQHHQTPRSGGVGRTRTAIRCAADKAVTSRHEILSCSFSALVQKDPGKSSSIALVQRVLQVLLNTALWPVLRRISSVNYVLNDDATFRETNLGYQPIVLFWPQTQFS